MTDRSATRSDGAAIQQDDDPGEERPDLAIDFPDDSLFTLEEYLEMYSVASSPPAFRILHALSEHDRLSESELSELLDREGNELHYYLRKLKRSALIRNRRDPNTGTEEPYSYYALTDLGKTVLTCGLKAGIEKVAEEEGEISEKYSE